MDNLGNLSVIIVTYNTTEKIILDCLNSIQNNIKVLIVENSRNFLHKDKSPLWLIPISAIMKTPILIPFRV